MFGIAVASLDQVTDAEKERYQALYCGLCRSLKQEFGQVSRLALNYDMAFFVMLCNSLHEPPEEKGWSNCISHPKKKMPFAQSKYSTYAAHLTVALAYHKCLDDVADDNSVKGRAGQAALSGAYKKAEAQYPAQCHAIEQSMQRIRQIEAAPDSPPDAAAHEFGLVLAEIFSHNQGFWTEAVRDFSYHLGKFVYLMDAAVDLDDDVKSGSYNPFAKMNLTPQEMRQILGTEAGELASRFEKLPLVEDVHLMRSVIYSGIWQKFNIKYSKTNNGNTNKNGEGATSNRDA